MKSFLKTLLVDAISEDGVIMALHHKTLPIFGIQFHPEAVLTQHGHHLLQNFITICESERLFYENVC
jgi:para-aminobenzoate synthetase component 2